jgi:hypothetical protein
MPSCVASRLEPHSQSGRFSFGSSYQPSAPASMRYPKVLGWAAALAAYHEHRESLCM